MNSPEDKVSKVDEPRFAIAQVLGLVSKDHPDN
jgi:hypothetical protein